VQLCFAYGVDQPVADVVLPARLGDGTVGQVIGTTATPFIVADGAFNVQIGAGRIDQLELPGAGQVGTDDFRHALALGIACEVGNGDRILRGADPRNIDSQLGKGRACSDKADRQQK